MVGFCHTFLAKFVKTSTFWPFSCRRSTCSIISEKLSITEKITRAVSDGLLRLFKDLLGRVKFRPLAGPSLGSRASPEVSIRG